MTQHIQKKLTLSGMQFLYVKPEVLNASIHGTLRYKGDSAPFVNVERIHLVPLLVCEFAQAMMHYPIIFAGEEKTPLAVMGLAAGQNLFVKNGRFEEDAYVPACLRHHPFTLGSVDEKFVVCIDRAASGFVTGTEGEALFENGEPSEFTLHAMAFLTEFEAESARTKAFIDTLKAAGLFKLKNTAFIAQSPQEQKTEYFAVAEERLGTLSDEQLGGLVRSGAMAASDAHLLSLQRWNALLARRPQTAFQDEPLAAQAA
jgi:hypothetical protein